MAFSRAHNSTKAVDVGKLLPLSKHRVTHMHSMAVHPSNRNPTLTTTTKM